MCNELRAYQRKAVEQLIAALKRRPLLVSPTASGKTTIASSLVQRTGLRTLWLAHRKELIDQAAGRLRSHGLDVGVIMAGCKPTPQARVHVASVQTLVRRDKPPAELIVIDESHRATAQTYSAILDAYPDACVVGMTATTVPARWSRARRRVRGTDHRGPDRRVV